MSNPDKVTLTQSAAFLTNAGQWPEFDGYTALSQGSGRAQIRVLDLSYDKHNKSIQGALMHQDLEGGSQNEPYFALSYYWGAPGAQKSMMLHGKQIQLRKNVYDFLKVLGLRFGRIRVWLDILCINQKDIGERNQQVSIMHQIYSKSKAVYTWLGKGDNDTDALFDALNFKSKHDSQIWTPNQHVKATKILSYVNSVLAHPYFTRVWVIQECAMARDVYLVCGSRIIERRRFVNRIREIDKSVSVIGPKTHNQGYLDRKLLRQARRVLLTQVTNEMEHERLLDLMDKFSSARCEDIRDKIFGLRGLAKEKYAIQIDYSKGIVYTALKTLTVTDQTQRGSTLASFFSGAAILSELLPLDVTDIRAGLQEIYSEVHSDQNQQQTLDKSCTRLVNSFVASSPVYYATTDRQFLVEKDVFCTRCVSMKCGSASYIYTKTPLTAGSLVQPQFKGPGGEYHSLAIVSRQGHSDELEIFELGMFVREDILRSLPDHNEKWTSSIEEESSVKCYRSSLKEGWIDFWSRIHRLCFPGGFGVCAVQGMLHYSPVVLFISLIWKHRSYELHIWSEEEMEGLLKVLEIWVEENEDTYRQQRLCCCHQSAP